MNKISTPVSANSLLVDLHREMAVMKGKDRKPLADMVDATIALERACLAQVDQLAESLKQILPGSPVREIITRYVETVRSAKGDALHAIAELAEAS